jgi:N-succinyldiaminopimelate aminotransferase
LNPRLDLLQPYPFERLRTLLAGARPPTALPHIPLSIGEPRHPPPAFIAEALTRALGESLGSYPVALGLPLLREAIARWLERRFRLPAGAVRADDMVLPVNGTREALFSLVQAAVDSGAGARGARPLVLMPNPFYQIYEGAALLAGAEPRFLDCTAATGYLPDLDAVDAATWDRCQVLFLCTPGNPTGAVMPEDYLARALALSARHGFLIASDECYSELYFDEASPPPGLLQAAFRAGNVAFERCVVFHSLSKRSSVPGLRSGFVAGDPACLARYRLYRTYHGCAVPLHTQLASVPAWNDEAHVIENRRLYREKFLRVTPRDRGSAAAGPRDSRGRLLSLAARRRRRGLYAPAVRAAARHRPARPLPGPRDGGRQPRPRARPDLARREPRRLRRGRASHCSVCSQRARCTPAPRIIG